MATSKVLVLDFGTAWKFILNKNNTEIKTEYHGENGADNFMVFDATFQ